jgi:hypothetical protein
MPFENTIQKRACVEEFEQLYKSLYTALLTHDDVLFLAPHGVRKVCSTVRAIQDQPKFTDQQPRILLLLHDPYVVNKLGLDHDTGNSGMNLLRVFPGLHTNRLKKQLDSLPDMIAGTPAKILEIIKKGYIEVGHFDAIIIEDVSSFRYFGYFDHLEQILELAIEPTKVIFTSSIEDQESLPLPLRTKPHLVNQLRLNFPFKFHAFTIISDEEDKPKVLFRLLCELFPHPTIVFCNHRGAVIRLQKILASMHLQVGMIHGGLEDVELNDTLAMFKNGSLMVLLTTDLALTEVSISELKYIVHYHMPLNEQSYLRRNNILLKHNQFATAFHIIQEDEDQPDFIHTLPDVIELSDQVPTAPTLWWNTLKVTTHDKVNIENQDIVQILVGVGKLHRDEIGLIKKISDTFYIAVSYRKVQKTMERINGLKFRNTIISAETVEELYS